MRERPRGLQRCRRAMERLLDVPSFRLATDTSATVSGFLFFAARSFLMDMEHEQSMSWNREGGEVACQ